MDDSTARPVDRGGNGQLAADWPGAPPLTLGDETRTGVELEASTSRLAHFLDTLGAVDDDFVTIAVEGGGDACGEVAEGALAARPDVMSVTPGEADSGTGGSQGRDEVGVGDDDDHMGSDAGCLGGELGASALEVSRALSRVVRRTSRPVMTATSASSKAQTSAPSALEGRADRARLRS